MVVFTHHTNLVLPMNSVTMATSNVSDLSDIRGLKKDSYIVCIYVQLNREIFLYFKISLKKSKKGKTHYVSMALSQYHTM